MIGIKINKHGLLTGVAGTILLSLSSASLALDKISPIAIPMVDNAQVFADFTDDIPAVLNYFTSSTESELIHFYSENYGEPLSQERKRERLTLTYNNENKAIRVIISQQNNKRQVDILVNSH